MSSRKRKSTFSGYSDRTGDGLRMLRNVVALLALGGACFVVGFFVFARFVPQDKSNAVDAPAQPGAPTTNSNTAAANPTPAPQAAPAPTPTPKANAPGPTIDPIPSSAVQTPSVLDDNANASAQGDAATANAGSDAATGAAPATAETPRRRRSARQNEKTDRQAADQSAPDDRSNAAAPPQDATQPNGLSADRNDAPAAETPRRSQSLLYHVQTGVFATQEAADKEADRVRSRGFEATVNTMEHDGRTLYRVQHATYRKRANAEAERQRLAEAGISATVSTIP